MDLLLATNNEHKRRELASILTAHRVRMPAELDLAFSFAETGDTFLANALGKALTLFDLSGGVPVIADDSGLCVEALGGRPGVTSARYGSPDGGATELASSERNALLLSELAGATDRRAHFVCCMVALIGSDRFFVAQETWSGEIARQPSAGTGGFGYDPVFLLPERGETAADLPADEKNRISHRGKAAVRLGHLLGELDRQTG